MGAKCILWTIPIFCTLKIPPTLSSNGIAEQQGTNMDALNESFRAPLLSISISGGALQLLNSEETLQSYEGRGFTEAFTITNRDRISYNCTNFKDYPTYHLKCKAPYPIKWYIRTSHGKHLKDFWGRDSQEHQNPVKTSITFDGKTFMYESEVVLNRTDAIVVKCMDLHHPENYSAFVSSCQHSNCCTGVLQGRPWVSNSRNPLRSIELAGTWAGTLSRITEDPRWIKWQGDAGQGPLLLLPCAVNDRDLEVKLRYKHDGNFVEIPPESASNFVWNHTFGYVLQKRSDPENYTMWKGRTFGCFAQNYSLTIEPIDLDYPIVTIGETQGETWPFACGMREESVSADNLIPSRGRYFLAASIYQKYRLCESVRTCAKEPSPTTGLNEDGKDCLPGSKYCFKEKLPNYGEVHCYARVLPNNYNASWQEFYWYDYTLARFFFRGLDRIWYVLPTTVPSNAVIEITGGGLVNSTNAPHEFTCRIVTYFLKPFVRFAAELMEGGYEILPDDKTKVKYHWLNPQDSILQKTVTIQLKSRYKAMACFSPEQNTSQWRSATTAFPEIALADTTTVWIICVALIIATIILAGPLYISRMKYLEAKKKLRELTSAEVTEFLEGSSSRSTNSLLSNETSPLNRIEELASRPFTKTIDNKDLFIDLKSLLGSGAFGLVYKGVFLGTPVAVKTVKPSADVDKFKTILEEVKVMEYIGEHPNVVKFFGAEVSNIAKRQIWIVLELSPDGSLLEHLRSLTRSSALTASEKGGSYVDWKFPVENLISWCEQIACAMQYLEELKVIHGDLATRNILVFDDRVKITDFGLSKRLYENPIYTRKPGKIPWRWLAPESLQYREFSHQSDVWSFGVTAWEVFTFGQVPYTEILDWSPNFLARLEGGLKLSQPEAMSNEIYDKLKECWSLDKEKRPSFEELVQFFGNPTGQIVDSVEYADILV